jgi:hypothetical protein
VLRNQAIERLTAILDRDLAHRVQVEPRALLAQAPAEQQRPLIGRTIDQIRATAAL